MITSFSLTSNKSIEILGQKYYLSGIINDYSVAWNHPKDETGIFPTILVSKSNTSLQNKKLVNTRHLLIENEKNFQDKIYQKHKNLISNENKKTQDFNRFSYFVIPMLCIS